MSTARTASLSQSTVITYKYVLAIASGVLLAEDRALREIEETLQIAERAGEDVGLGLVRLTLGLALVHRDPPVDRERGLEVLERVRDCA